MSIEENAKLEAHKIIVDELKAKLTKDYWKILRWTNDEVAFRRDSLEARIALALQQKETQNKNLQENFDDAAKINKDYQSTISRLEGELKEYEERLTELEEEQRCSECKCATPGEAESKECGCDAPVCAIERPDTLATAFEKQFAELTRLREALAVLLDSKGCLTRGNPEIAEEISGHFDIGLEQARKISELSLSEKGK